MPRTPNYADIGFRPLSNWVGRPADLILCAARQTGEKTVTQLSGIDVSHHQGDISWQLLDLTDVNFCFIKATDGVPTDTDTGVDPKFSTNWSGTKSAGLIRGAYHFFRPARPVAGQVANFTAQVGTLDLKDLPPALDLEIPQDDPTAWTGVTPSQAVSLALDWLNRVQILLGRKPIVYMDLNFFSQVLGGSAAGLQSYALWIARYTNASDPGAPSDWNAWTFWQYSETGTHIGIGSPGNLDLNWFNGSEDDLKSFIASSIVLGNDE